MPRFTLLAETASALLPRPASGQDLPADAKEFVPLPGRDLRISARISF